MNLPRTHLNSINTLSDHSGELPGVNLYVAMYYFVALGRLLPSHSVFCQNVDENLYDLPFKFLSVLNMLILACHLEHWHLESSTCIVATIAIHSWWQMWELENSFTHLSDFFLVAPIIDTFNKFGLFKQV